MSTIPDKDVEVSAETRVPQLWLTYQEIAQELECDAEQARAVAIARGWTRKHSRDGFSRVKMPVDLMHAYFARASRDAALNEQANTPLKRRPTAWVHPAGVGFGEVARSG